jgi:hypothetical protein
MASNQTSNSQLLEAISASNDSTSYALNQLNTTINNFAQMVAASGVSNTEESPALEELSVDHIKGFVKDSIEQSMLPVITGLNKQLTLFKADMASTLETAIASPKTASVIGAEIDRAASESKKWHQKTITKCAIGAAVVGTGAYFILRANAKANTAMVTAGSNQSFLKRLGAEEVADGSLLLTGVSGFGKTEG